MSSVLSRSFARGSFRSQVAKASRAFSSSTDFNARNYRPYKDTPCSELAMNGAMFFAMSQGAANWAMPVVESFIGKNSYLDKSIEFGLDNTAMKMFFIGKNLEEAKESVRKDAKKNIKTIFDYSPEGSENPSSDYYDDVTSVIVETAKAARELSQELPEQLAPAIAIKIPASPEFMERVSSKFERSDVLNESDTKEWDDTQRRVFDIFEAAQGKGKKKVDVLIDAEWSSINPAIDKLAEHAREKGYDPIETVQCYLKDSPEKVSRIIEKGGSAKLVRGAYMESENERAQEEGRPSPVFSKKKQTDDNYDEGVRRLVQAGNRVIVATHNDKSAKLAAELKEENIDADITVATLKGMPAPYCGDKVQKAIYGPWVKKILEGFPYFVRRTQENSGDAGKKGLKHVTDEAGYRFQDLVTSAPLREL